MCFDDELVIHINSVLMTLNQLGVGPDNPFVITGESETWTDFLGEVKYLEATKLYMHLQVKILFDPPTQSYVLAVMKEKVAEYEQRLLMQVEREVTVQNGK